MASETTDHLSGGPKPLPSGDYPQGSSAPGSSPQGEALDRRSWAVLYITTFLVSAAVLVLEVALTRVFSVLTWHHFTHMILSVALLGFGAAGSYASRHSRLTTLADVSRYAGYFALAVLIAFLTATRITFEPLRLGADWTQLIGLGLHEVLLAGPFFFAGLVIVTLITVGQERVHTVYFADLIGGSIGGAASVLTMRLLGVPTIILLVACVAAVSSMMTSWIATRRERRRAIGIAALVFSVLVLIRVTDPYLVYAPMTKDMYGFANPAIGAPEVDLSTWHPIARVDITKPFVADVPPFGGNLSRRFERTPWRQRAIFQDGTAPTWMLESDGSIEKMHFLDGFLQAAPYSITPRANTLVIGVGGGIDVLTALRHGANHVTGVEINPVTLDAVENRYRSFVGNLLSRPEVTTHRAEGRHFIAKSHDHYDVIQLSGVDTLTALASGAYALAENYLYTREAIETFWDHLAPHGILSISRWHFAPPRETLRLFATFVEAAASRGVEQPDQHLMVVAGPSWADTLLRRSAFTRPDVDAVTRWASLNGFHVEYDPFTRRDSSFDAIARKGAIERARFYDNYRYEVRPATDDWPYFFDYYKWKGLFSPEGAPERTSDFPMALRTLALSLIQILILAIVGIVWPRSNRRLVARHGSGRMLGYFAALGLGFMFVEITLIQKLTIVLGGTTDALAFTLFAMLLFSGIGSQFARRWQGQIARAFVPIGIAVVVSIVATNEILHFGASRWLGYTWQIRVSILLVVIAPMAFLMGMPMPIGLSLLRQTHRDWIPWAWATNGFLTVLGPLAGAVLSMQIGYRAVLFVAAFIYVVGFVVFLPLVRAADSEPLVEASQDKALVTSLG